MLVCACVAVTIPRIHLNTKLAAGSLHLLLHDTNTLMSLCKDTRYMETLDDKAIVHQPLQSDCRVIAE